MLEFISGDSKSLSSLLILTFESLLRGDSMSKVLASGGEPADRCEILPVRSLPPTDFNVGKLKPPLLNKKIVV